MKKQTLKNFYNPISEDNKIFTGEEIAKMSLEDFQKNEDAIMYQYENFGVPYERQLKNNNDVVFVHEYRREDGTIVKAHYRSKPDGIEINKQKLDGKIEYNIKKKENNKFINPYVPYNPYSLSEAIDLFAQNKIDMENANIKNSDKYFHAKANFQAAQSGLIVDALILDIGKELFDLIQKNHLKKNGKSYNTNLEDSLSDLKADFYGLIQGFKNQKNENYKDALKKYRVDGIDEKY